MSTFRRHDSARTSGRCGRPPIDVYKRQREARLQTQFFDKSFLAGSLGSLLDIKYVAPVLDQRQLEAVPLYRSDPESKGFLERLQKGVELCSRKEEFFELRLRNLFSELWESIYRWAAQKESSTPSLRRSIEDDRIKQMMRYVQAHFSEKISVSSIAASIPCLLYTSRCV